MYLTRQAAGFLLFASLVTGMLAVFGLVQASRADEVLAVSDGGVQSVFADEAERLGRETPASADGPLIRVVDDPAPADDPATAASVPEPLLGDDDVLPAHPDELVVDESGPMPQSLRIASHRIDAPVVPVGVDDDLHFEVPPAAEIGWYKFGPTPGAQGSAVLAAHVDWAGSPGAFFDLRHVGPGDRVEITFDDGSLKYWEIVANRQYLKEDVPVDQLFERKGDPRLVLVTCGGVFDNVKRHYEDNVVVYAKPLSI